MVHHPCYESGDAIEEHRECVDELTKIIPWDESHNRLIHSKNRIYNVNPCGSEDFLDDI